MGSDGYELIAANLLAGHGYRFFADLGETLSRPPAYPLFLAAIFQLCGGPKLWPVQATQALLGALTACMAYQLALPFGRRAAMVSGLIFALYPGDLVACSRYLAEPLSMVSLMAALLLIQRLLDRPNTLFLGLAVGFCFLVVVLSRDINFMLPVLLPAAAVSLPSARGHRRAFLRVSAVALVPVVALSSLWCLRNYKLSGMVVFPSSNSGSTAFDGHYIGNHLGDGRTVRELMRESRLLQCEIARAHGIEPQSRFAVLFKDPRDEAHLSRILIQDVKDRVISQPRAFLKQFLIGMARFWYLGPTPSVSWAATALNGPLLLLASFGFWRAAHLRYQYVVLWLVIILYYNGVCASVNPLVRYALPTIPLMAALAGIAISVLWLKLFPQTRPRSASSVSGHTTRDTV